MCLNDSEHICSVDLKNHYCLRFVERGPIRIKELYL